MKKCCLTMVLLALVSTLLLSTEYAAGNSVCPLENCLDSKLCDDLLVGGTCPQTTDTCCSVVKTEHRTHCRHFGGECMDYCHQNLQNIVVDCPADKICCTLV
ncbi:uncharacterized protein LOC122395186 [Colletes gigas]|uniref:uncharacterized protein LOC122395186 n=1 Tax=Colletes gigas TaxID=935657 RepID=UPI001C9B1E94|nr:uncharacterized protein LOC122395186 [Colletes gigas]